MSMLYRKLGELRDMIGNLWPDHVGVSPSFEILCALVSDDVNIPPAPEAICNQVKQELNESRYRGFTFCNDGVLMYCNWETGPQKECVDRHERLHVQDPTQKCFTPGLHALEASRLDKAKSEVCAYRASVACVEEKMANPGTPKSDLKELSRYEGTQLDRLHFYEVLVEEFRR